MEYGEIVRHLAPCGASRTDLCRSPFYMLTGYGIIPVKQRDPMAS